MIKSLGLFLIVVFIVLSTQMGGFAPGFSIYFLSVLVLAAGVFGFALFTTPEDVEAGAIHKIREPMVQSIADLCNQIEELALTIRRDGLLSLEAKRKDLKDPFLRYLLKKVMDGYEKAQLLPILRNQAVRRAELIRGVEIFILRVISFLPTIGLVPSLFMMMAYLSEPKAGAGAASLATVFIPFVLSLILGLVAQAWTERWFDELKEEVKLYYLVIEEGLTGIQDGLNSDLIRDKLKARVMVSPKWTES